MSRSLREVKILEPCSNQRCHQSLEARSLVTKGFSPALFSSYPAHSLQEEALSTKDCPIFPLTFFSWDYWDIRMEKDKDYQVVLVTQRYREGKYPLQITLRLQELWPQGDGWWGAEHLTLGENDCWPEAAWFGADHLSEVFIIKISKHTQN